jgi:putative ABC transport system ATP-binding protein
MSPLLSMAGVRKTYDTGAVQVEALRGIDLEIEYGEYVAIMGPSGSGKSTLMHIIGCLDVPTTGRYELDGEEVAQLTENQLADIRNRRLGFVFQSFNLLPSLTAQRNVELPLVYAGVAPAERRERARAALERVGLGNRRDHRPGELSGGQQQRVSVARALVTDPALILADEPTGALDSVSTRDILDLFTELNASGRTIVVITHEADVAERAHRIVHIYDGLLTDAAREENRTRSGSSEGKEGPDERSEEPTDAAPENRTRSGSSEGKEGPDERSEEPTDQPVHALGGVA